MMSGHVLGTTSGHDLSDLALGTDQVIMDSPFSMEAEALKHIRRTTSGLKRAPFLKLGVGASELVMRYLDCVRAGSDAMLEPHIGDQCSKTLKRLVLHVDLNKTILMSDSVQGADMHHIVNMLLSECTWGRMEVLEGQPHWEPVGRLATDRPCGDPELMTYRHFLDTFLLPYDEGEGTEVEHHNNLIKKRRQELKRSFTEDGQPGDMFIGVHKKLCQKLALPPREAVGEFLHGRTERHIVPSFFNLLKYLQAEDLDFTLVFRTFGSDLADVAEEMNLFASGQHPSHPGVKMDGSDGRVDVRLLEEDGCFGSFYRDGLGEGGTQLALGVPLELLSRKWLDKEDIVSAGTESDSALLFSGLKSVYTGLHDRVNQSGCHAMAIRDYYPFWKSHNERSHAGKLLLVDNKDESIMHIFLDDNIGYDEAHIVDARNVSGSSPLLFDDVIGTNLVKVEALNAILDNSYFTRAVETAVRRWTDERAGCKSATCSNCSTPSKSPPNGLSKSTTPPNGQVMSPFGSGASPGMPSHKSLGDLMKASSQLVKSPLKSLLPSVTSSPVKLSNDSSPPADDR